MKRIPLWATLIPLVAGVGLWGWMWRGYAAGFEADLARVLPANSGVEAGGFPYRLEADIRPIDLLREDEALKVQLRAEAGRVNRVPWQTDMQVINVQAPVARIELKPLAGALALVAAPEAQASLRLEAGRIARLSILWEGAEIQTGLFATKAVARHFEAHLREAPESEARGASPRLPTRAEVHLSAEDIRFGSGDPLKFSVEAELAAAATIRSFAGWADGGTVEIEGATISDKTGEIAKLKATLAPDGQRGLEVAGTIETVCPQTVRAAMSGTAALPEMRTRKPELIAITGSLPGKVTAAPSDPNKPPAPVRGQEPPCPRLR